MKNRFRPERESAPMTTIALLYLRAVTSMALMKGSLHTDDLMTEVVRTDGGIRTGRRISHVFVMDVPTY